MTQKAFVLLSGGIDSTTCLHIARENYREVEAISINYDQKHAKEMDFAAKTCYGLGIKHAIWGIGPLLAGRGVMLTDTSTPIPSMSYEEIKGVSPTYVPFRNGTLLSLITAHAQKWIMQEIADEKAKDEAEYGKGAYTEQSYLDQMKDSVGIYFGAHAEDAHNWAYPDCTPEFIGSMANAIYTGTYYTVRLQAPLMSLTKAQIIEWGERLGVRWEDTWSCYAGGEYHCGTCPTCRARKQAFDDANVEDPTEYSDTRGKTFTVPTDNLRTL